MVLIKCIECGYDFSSFAVACPECGCPTTVIIEKGIKRDTISVNQQNQAFSEKPTSTSNNSLVPKKKEYTILSKILITVFLWFGWAFIASIMFGDGDIGTIIQGVVQLGGTFYIWMQPTKKEK